MGNEASSLSKEADSSYIHYRSSRHTSTDSEDGSDMKQDRQHQARPRRNSMIGSLRGNVAAAVSAEESSKFVDPVLSAAAAGAQVRKGKQARYDRGHSQTRQAKRNQNNEWKTSLQRLAKTAASTANSMAQVTGPVLADASLLVAESAKEFATDVKEEFTKPKYMREESIILFPNSPAARSWSGRSWYSSSNSIDLSPGATPRAGGDDSMGRVSIDLTSRNSSPPPPMPKLGTPPNRSAIAGGKRSNSPKKEKSVKISHFPELDRLHDKDLSWPTGSKTTNTETETLSTVSEGATPNGESWNDPTEEKKSMADSKTQSSAEESKGIGGINDDQESEAAMAEREQPSPVKSSDDVDGGGENPMPEEEVIFRADSEEHEGEVMKTSANKGKEFMEDSGFSTRSDPPANDECSTDNDAHEDSNKKENNVTVQHDNFNRSTRNDNTDVDGCDEEQVGERVSERPEISQNQPDPEEEGMDIMDEFRLVVAEAAAEGVEFSLRNTVETSVKREVENSERTHSQPVMEKLGGYLPQAEGAEKDTGPAGSLSGENSMDKMDEFRQVVAETEEGFDVSINTESKPHVPVEGKDEGKNTIRELNKGLKEGQEGKCSEEDPCSGNVDDSAVAIAEASLGSKQDSTEAVGHAISPIHRTLSEEDARIVFSSEEIADEKRELKSLLERLGMGEKVDEDRLYELELFERYRQGEELNQDEIDDFDYLLGERRQREVYRVAPKAELGKEAKLPGDSISTTHSETAVAPKGIPPSESNDDQEIPGTSNTEIVQQMRVLDESNDGEELDIAETSKGPPKATQRLRTDEDRSLISGDLSIVDQSSGQEGWMFWALGDPQSAPSKVPKGEVASIFNGAQPEANPKHGERRNISGLEKGWPQSRKINASVPRPEMKDGDVASLDEKKLTQVKASVDIDSGVGWRFWASFDVSPHRDKSPPLPSGESLEAKERQVRGRQEQQPVSLTMLDSTESPSTESRDTSQFQKRARMTTRSQANDGKRDEVAPTIANSRVARELCTSYNPVIERVDGQVKMLVASDQTNIETPVSEDKYLKELEILTNRKSNGEAIDEERLYFLKLYERRFFGGDLLLDELSYLEEFESEEAEKNASDNSPKDTEENVAIGAVKVSGGANTHELVGNSLSAGVSQDIKATPTPDLQQIKTGNDFSLKNQSAALAFENVRTEGTNLPESSVVQGTKRLSRLATELAKDALRNGVGLFQQNQIQNGATGAAASELRATEATSQKHDLKTKIKEKGVRLGSQESKLFHNSTLFDANPTSIYETGILSDSLEGANTGFHSQPTASTSAADLVVGSKALLRSVFQKVAMDDAIVEKKKCHDWESVGLLVDRKPRRVVQESVFWKSRDEDLLPLSPLRSPSILSLASSAGAIEGKAQDDISSVVVSPWDLTPERSEFRLEQQSPLVPSKSLVRSRPVHMEPMSDIGKSSHSSIELNSVNGSAARRVRKAGRLSLKAYNEKEKSANPPAGSAATARLDGDRSSILRDVPSPASLVDKAGKDIPDVALIAVSSLESVDFLKQLPHKVPTDSQEKEATILWKQLVANWKHAKLWKEMLSRPCSRHFETLAEEARFSDDSDSQCSDSTIRFQFQNRKIFSGALSAASSFSVLKNLGSLESPTTDEDLMTLSEFLCDLGPQNFEEQDENLKFLRHICMPKVPTEKEAPLDATSLLKLAESQLDEFTVLVKSIATFSSQNDPTSEIKLSVGMKNYSSTRKKAARKYGGDVLQVKDIVRGQITFPDEHSLVCGLYYLHKQCDEDSRKDPKSPQFAIVRLKNLFGVSSTSFGTLPTGYKHVLVNVRIRGGIIAEIQFQLEQFLSVMGSEGYSLHQEISSLEDWKHEGNAPHTSEESPRQQNSGISISGIVNQLLSLYGPSTIVPKLEIDEPGNVSETSRRESGTVNDNLGERGNLGFADEKKPIEVAPNSSIGAAAVHSAKNSQYRAGHIENDIVEEGVSIGSIAASSSKTPTPKSPGNKAVLGGGGIAAIAAAAAKDRTKQNSAPESGSGIAAAAAAAAKVKHVPQSSNGGGIAAAAAAAAAAKSTKSQGDKAVLGEAGIASAAAAKDRALEKSDHTDDVQSVTAPAPQSGLGIAAAAAASARGKRDPELSNGGGIAAAAAAAAAAKSTKSHADEAVVGGGIASAVAAAANDRTLEKSDHSNDVQSATAAPKSGLGIAAAATAAASSATAAPKSGLGIAAAATAAASSTGERDPDISNGGGIAAASAAKNPKPLGKEAVLRGGGISEIAAAAAKDRTAGRSVPNSGLDIAAAAAAAAKGKQDLEPSNGGGIAAAAAAAAATKSTKSQGDKAVLEEGVVASDAAAAAKDRTLEKSDHSDDVQSATAAPKNSLAIAAAAAAAASAKAKRDSELSNGGGIVAAENAMPPGKESVLRGGGIAEIAAAAAKDRTAQRSAPNSGLGFAAAAAAAAAKSTKSQGDKSVLVGGIASAAAAVAKDRTQEASDHSDDFQAATTAPTSGLGIAATAAAAAKRKGKQTSNPINGGGIAAAAAAAAAAKGTEKAARRTASARSECEQISVPAAPSQETNHKLPSATLRSGAAGKDEREKELLKEAMGIGADQAASNPRDLPSFYCLYLIAKRLDDIAPGSCLIQPKAEQSATVPSIKQLLLLRSLAISNQASSTGMVGWLEYGSSNVLERHFSLPFEVLQQLAYNSAFDDDWHKACDILRALVLRCKLHLASYHPTTVSSMLDLASALSMVHDHAHARAMVQTVSDLVGLYLSEHEALFFDNLRSREEFERDANKVFLLERTTDAISMMRAFATTFHSELSRDFLKLLGPEHRISLLNHALVADSFVVLGNCVSAGGTMEKHTQLEYWSLAYLHYQHALRGWTKLEGLSHPNAVSAAYGIARCLRELGRLEQALRVLEPLVEALQVSPEYDETIDEEEVEMKHGVFGTFSFLPPSTFSNRAQHSKFRKSQALVLCLWTMATLTAEQNPDERGRARVLSLLHQASDTVRNLLLGHVDDMDETTRLVFFELYDSVECEASTLFEPLRQVQIQEERVPLRMKFNDSLTSMRRKRWERAQTSSNTSTHFHYPVQQFI